MRGLKLSSPKPQPAVGAAADVNLAAASSEWGAGEGAQKRSQTGREATGGLAGKTNQSGHKCLLRLSSNEGHKYGYNVVGSLGWSPGWEEEDMVREER